MPDTITFRITPTLRLRLEEFRQARCLGSVSEAVKTAIVEAALEPAERKTVPDRDELLVLLGVEARSGNVTAMKALLEEQRRDGSTDDKPALSLVDQLGAKRAERAVRPG